MDRAVLDIQHIETIKRHVIDCTVSSQLLHRQPAILCSDHKSKSGKSAMEQEHLSDTSYDASAFRSDIEKSHGTLPTADTTMCTIRVRSDIKEELRYAVIGARLGTIEEVACSILRKSKIESKASSIKLRFPPSPYRPLLLPYTPLSSTLFRFDPNIRLSSC